MHIPIDRALAFMRSALTLIFLLAISLETLGQVPESPHIAAARMGLEPHAATFSQIVDRTVAKEQELIQLMDNLTPLVETYVQIMRRDQHSRAMVPVKDTYFLGKLEPEHEIKVTSYLGEPGILNRITTSLSERHRTRLTAQAFAMMIFPDKENFDRMHYDFQYAGQERLGSVLCLRFNVQPKPGSGQGHFLGRIWVEDEDYTIVRFNGALTNSPQFRNKAHLDSWRLNFFPRVWLPAYVYSEESDAHAPPYKAQTRLWAYDLQHAGDHREFEQKLAEAIVAGDHIDSGVELSPILSERSFHYSGEEDLIERLQVVGLAAPHGVVDEALESIVEKLLLTNDTQGPYSVRCRVLLTTPLGLFSVGQTIFMSRGLLDVVSDEATLALLLAHELGHMMLGHSVIVEGAFNDDALLGNTQVLSRLLHFHSDPAAEHEADEKALQLLANSQYRQKLSSAARFLRALNTASSQLPNLISPHLRLTSQDLLLAPMIRSLSRVKVQSQDPGTLPLGSRIKLNPWNNRIELIQPTPIPLLPFEEGMSLQLTPFHPYLSRLCLGAVAAAHQQ